MQWKSFPKPLKLALEETAERVLEDDNATLRESFIDALEYRLQMSFEEASTRLPIHALLQQLDLYIKSMGRLLILEQLQGIPIDVFGDANGWMALIGDRCPHVTVRGALPYKSVLERMTQTKVILSNCESVRDGAHERIFAALSSGAAVAVRGNPFLRNAFGSNKGVLLYGQQDGNLSDLVLKAIENDVWRSQSVESGQKEVAEHHLWDHRAAEILKVFTHWLPEMPRRDPSLQ